MNRHCQRWFGSAIVTIAALWFCGCSRQPVERIEWPVMGTVAAVQTRGGDAAATRKIAESVKRDFAAIEKLLNAHDPNSEIRRLAALTDAEVLAKCDPSVRACYAAAFRFRDETGGAFNPRWRGTNTLDLGAIAKGFAVDVAAEHLSEAGDTLIDLGGNLKAVRGDWRVGIKDGGTFTLGEGEACATSARYYRGNHIKDGRNGGEVTNAVESVTVVHPSSAMLADGLSTTMFVLGEGKGGDFIRLRYPEAKVAR